jgi:hypothetical protein
MNPAVIPTAIQEKQAMSEKLTREQAAIIGAFTGILCGPFPDMHKKIEDLMGRPVWTHEMGDKELMQQVRDLAKPDFLAICADMPAEVSQ